MTRTKIPDFICCVMGHRLIPSIIAIIAIIITLPSLWYGWILDDLLHRVILTGSGDSMWSATPSEMKVSGLNTLLPALRESFAFFDPAINKRLIDLGIVPWWTSGELRLTFFRPLAALTHWLDYQIWPNSAIAMHAHSILWYGCVCGLAAIFYRKIMGSFWIAGLAALFFAIDDAHYIAVSWLANRYALITLFFSLLSLIFHDRWRREGWRAGLVVAPLLFALALLSGEMAVAGGAYIAAYALVLDRGTWQQRLGSVIPYAFIVIPWHLAYRWMDFGAYGSGFYVDPGGEPLRYLKAAIERVPILILGQFGWPNPAMYNSMSTSARPLLWLFALFFIVLTVIIFSPLIRRDHIARFWGIGMVLAVLPVCGIGMLEGRLLLFAGLGAMGLVAQFVSGLAQQAKWTPGRMSWKIPAWVLCIFLVGLHVFYASLQLTGRGSRLGQKNLELFTNIGAPPEIERQDVVIVNAPSSFYFAYFRALRILNNQPVAARLRLLAPGYYPVEVIRLDTNTVSVRPLNGYIVHPGEGVDKNGGTLPSIHAVYLQQTLDMIFRSSAFPFSADYRVDIPGMSAEVTALTDDGRPSEAKIQFTVPLESDSLRWLQWDWEKRAYVPFTIPAIGKAVMIPGLL